MLFALIACGLWIVNSVYSIGYMRGNNEKNQTRFYVCFALSIAAALAIAFAANLLTLFLFYEVLTLITYPLVTHAGTEKARQGGRIYLGHPDGHLGAVPAAGGDLHLACRRHHRFPRRRHPAGRHGQRAR